jgi:hypothetical protein
MEHMPQPMSKQLTASSARRSVSRPVCGIDPFIVVGSCAGADVVVVLVVC